MKRAKRYNWYRYLYGVRVWCAEEILLHISNCDFLYDDGFDEPLIIGYRK